MSKKVAFIVVMCALFMFIFICLTMYFFTFSSGLSDNHQNWGEFGAFFSGIITPLALTSIVVSFYLTRYSTLKTNSLNVCITVLNDLKEESFRQSEKLILRELPKIIDQVKTFDDIENEELRKSIIKYCNTMNHLSVFVVHELIDPKVLIAYYGIPILNMYNLLHPLIDANKIIERTKITNAGYFSLNSKHGEADKQLILRVLSLYYAHFEILAQEIRKSGDAVIEEIEKKMS